MLVKEDSREKPLQADICSMVTRSCLEWQIN